MRKPLVGIVMGSDSDLPVMRGAAERQRSRQEGRKRQPGARAHSIFLTTKSIPSTAWFSSTAMGRGVFSP